MLRKLHGIMSKFKDGATFLLYLFDILLTLIETYFMTPPRRGEKLIHFSYSLFFMYNL